MKRFGIILGIFLLFILLILFLGITPVLNSSEDNYLEGKFIQLPLAGYGDRKGKPGIRKQFKPLPSADGLKL